MGTEKGCGILWIDIPFGGTDSPVVVALLNAHHPHKCKFGGSACANGPVDTGVVADQADGIELDAWYALKQGHGIVAIEECDRVQGVGDAGDIDNSVRVASDPNSACGERSLRKQAVGRRRRAIVVAVNDVIRKVHRRSRRIVDFDGLVVARALEILGEERVVALCLSKGQAQKTEAE